MFLRQLTANAGHKDGSSPFWKQRSWVASATFLGLVLVVGLMSLATAEDGVGATISGDGGSGRTSETRAQHGCDPEERRQAKPKSAPRDVRWRKLDMVQVPVSRSAGPLKSDGPVMWCFARTPLGAAMAAHVIPSQMSGARWRTVAEHQLVPGPDRDLYAAQRSTIPSDSVESRSAGQYAGFAVSSYSRDAAKVRLLIKDARGGYGWTTVSLEWSGGDWKVAPQAGGTLHTSLTPTTGAAGFVLWGV